METSRTEVESQTIELSTKAFDAFCEDISGMFGVDMECKQQEAVAETIEGLKKRFKKLVAVNSIKAKGALDGTFQLMFGREGLFTLGGVIATLPEQKILQNTKSGSTEVAESMSDAIGEMGNILVGAWDRVFCEELDGHGHFAQTNTFIGDPWDNPEKKIGLAGDEEFVFVPYKMTIGPYPAFNCGIIFPKTIFESTPVSDTEQAEPEAEEKTNADAAKEAEPAEKEPAAEQTTAKEAVEPAVETKEEDASVEKTEPAEKEPEAEKVTEKEESAAKAEPEPAVEQNSDDVDTDVAEEKITPLAESEKQPVSETIQRMAQSSAVLPGESDHISLAISARDIMQKDVVWASGDDSVQQALTKIQQADGGYMVVGRDGVLEGIISKSDITGAISPYLRPVFAKWRRPLDDATLQIKVKWIMSRSVHTITPETSLAIIIDNMRQFGQRALPVMDQQGKVQGLVTVFDIFKALLNSNSNISTAGKTHEAPPLV